MRSITHKYLETKLRTEFLITIVANIDVFQLVFPDPQCWGQAHVVSWMRHKMQELKIPTTSSQSALQWAANFEGSSFVQIPEEEFKARLPEVSKKTIYVNLKKMLSTLNNLLPVINR